jgi:prepilin-type N-terminal cleavage/methylation domain-containing protein
MTTSALKLWLLYWWRDARSTDVSNGRSEAGLTLLECIVAMVMMSVVAVAITPPLFLATASRVQSNRAEQATQVAQGEVDKVRVTIERGQYLGEANPLALLPQEGSSDIFKTPAPNPNPDLATLESTRASCDKKVPFVPAATLRPVDIDGDCQPDFAVQTFRSPADAGSSITTVSGVRIPMAFKLGVRVWAYPPLLNNTLPLGTQPASLQLTTGTGQNTSATDATPKLYPLAVIYTQLARSDTKVSYEKLCRLLDGSEADCKANQEVK